MAATPLPTSDPALGAPPAPTLPLAQLRPGESAVVEHVDASRPIGRRLLDLGFVPGTLVRVVRRAPLGDPVSYELRGSRLCLRRAETLHIAVVRCAAAGATDTPER